MELEAGWILCAQLWSWAGLLQNLEFLKLSESLRGKILPGLLICLYLAILIFPRSELVLIALLLHLAQLSFWGGIFNGGSDYMTTATGLGLAIANLPSPRAKVAGLMYIAVQVIFSYVQAGFAKWRSSSWRQGTALVAYIGPQDSVVPLRRLLQRSEISWLLMIWEVSWVLILVWPGLAIAYVVSGILFHLGNVIFFRLNRFLWSWIAAYPALLVTLKLLSSFSSN